MDVRLVKTQRGTMAVLQLDDGTGQIEATAYSEVYEQNRDLLVKDQIVLADGRLQMDDFPWTAIIESKIVHHTGTGQKLSRQGAKAGFEA